MTIPPLCIIQARLKSTRLSRKMLRTVAGIPLIKWAWWQAVVFFRPENVIVACPRGDVYDFSEVLRGATVYGWEGPEWDVLGRFVAVAKHKRHAPTARIVRITPDDFPIQPWREITTLRKLLWANRSIPKNAKAKREHIGNLPIWSTPFRGEINTRRDYEAAKQLLEAK